MRAEEAGASGDKAGGHAGSIPPAVLIIPCMATTERRPGAAEQADERLTVAPVVGPDDPRRFTDSGIEIDELYTEADLPEQLDLGTPGECP